MDAVIGYGCILFAHRVLGQFGVLGGQIVCSDMSIRFLGFPTCHSSKDVNKRKQVKHRSGWTKGTSEAFFIPKDKISLLLLLIRTTYLRGSISLIQLYEVKGARDLRRDSDNRVIYEDMAAESTKDQGRSRPNANTSAYWSSLVASLHGEAWCSER
jgi:hypothetical protein